MERVRCLGEAKLKSGEKYSLDQHFSNGLQRLWKQEKNGISLVGKTFSTGCTGVWPEGYFFEKSFLRVRGRFDNHTILVPGFGVYDFPVDYLESKIDFYTQVFEKVPGKLQRQKAFYLDPEKHIVWVEDRFYVDFNADDQFYKTICLIDKKNDNPVFLAKKGKMVAFWQRNKLHYFSDEKEEARNFEITKKSPLVELVFATLK